MSNTPHCSTCGRFISHIRGVFKSHHYGAYLDHCEGICGKHGKVEVDIDHCWICEWFGGFSDAWNQEGVE